MTRINRNLESPTHTPHNSHARLFGITPLVAMLVTRLFALLLVLQVGCASAPPAVPLSATPVVEPDVTLVWVGRGKTERFEGAAFKRVPEFDYEFTVVQRRYAGHWESIKTMHRRHPEYDGSAGPRDQTMFFRVVYADDKSAPSIHSEIHSTLGSGEGKADREFRTAEITLTADTSAFAPFNAYRISQRYDYEGGALNEEVELLKRRDDGTESVWVKNQESATLFGHARFNEAPTRR